MLLLVLALAVPAAASSTTPLDPALRRAGLGFAWDPAWVGELGLVLPGPALAGAQTGWTADLRLPLALLWPPAGAELEGGLQGRWGESWGVGAGATSWLAWGRSDLGATVGWGTDLVARPGWTGARLSTALELGWHQSWLGWIRHSDAVMDLYGDRPGSVHDARRSVLLAAPAARLRAGLAGGWAWGEAVALGLGGTFEWTPGTLGMVANPSLGWLPFTMRATLELPW